MKIIGISGNATVGKDSYCHALIDLLSAHHISAKRFAFADELKYETDEFLKSSLGISAFTTDKEEKLLIRPFLVWWGTDFRRKLDDSHWINKVNDKLRKQKLISYSNPPLSIIKKEYLPKFNNVNNMDCANMAGWKFLYSWPSKMG